MNSDKKFNAGNGSHSSRGNTRRHCQEGDIPTIDTGIEPGDVPELQPNAYYLARIITDVSLQLALPVELFLRPDDVDLHRDAMKLIKNPRRDI